MDWKKYKKEFTQGELERELLNRQQRCQSGVAFSYEARLSGEGMPPDIAKALKHLRVGVDAAMVEHAGLVKLLVDKGIITTHEYFAAEVWAFDKELERLTKEVSKRYGNADITLGEAGFGQPPE